MYLHIHRRLYSIQNQHPKHKGHLQKMSIITLQTTEANIKRLESEIRKLKEQYEFWSMSDMADMVDEKQDELIADDCDMTYGELFDQNLANMEGLLSPIRADIRNKTKELKAHQKLKVHQTQAPRLYRLKKQLEWTMQQ